MPRSSITPKKPEDTTRPGRSGSYLGTVLFLPPLVHGVDCSGRGRAALMTVGGGTSSNLHPPSLQEKVGPSVSLRVKALAGAIRPITPDALSNRRYSVVAGNR